MMKMNVPFRATLLAAAMLAGSGAVFALTDVVGGNLVVVRVGDGAAALSSAAQAVFLEELTTAGSNVQTIALPTAVTGLNRRVTSSGTATSEGALSFSVDGQYMVYGGYDADVGTTSIASTTSAAVNRVIARVDRSGVVDSTTALTDGFSANNIRGAVSVDGTQFWATGPGGSPRFANLGDTTSTALVSGFNSRVAHIYNGQLYVSSAASTNYGVATIGTGLPTGSGESATLLAGFPTSSGPSPYAFFFADDDTLYVADDRANGSGGIQKWTQSSGTWSLQYTLAPALNAGCRGLTGVVNGGVATLYATTTQTNANSIVVVTDTGAGSAFSTVATAASNTVFRGIQLVPGVVVNTVVYCTAGTTTNGCVPSISSTGTPSVSASSGFTITVNDVEGQKLGLFFYSVSGANSLPWGSGSTSFLCVKSPTQRLPSQNSAGTFNQCNGVFTADFNAFFTANPGALGQPIAVNNSVWAQAWFRDPPAPKTTNLSDALQFTFAP